MSTSKQAVVDSTFHGPCFLLCPKEAFSFECLVLTVKLVRALLCSPRGYRVHGRFTAWKQPLSQRPKNASSLLSSQGKENSTNLKFQCWKYLFYPIWWDRQSLCFALLQLHKQMEVAEASWCLGYGREAPLDLCSCTALPCIWGNVLCLQCVSSCWNEERECQGGWWK